MKILFVEDHQKFIETVTKFFLASYQLTAVPSLSEARQALAQSSFEVILIDYDLKDGKGTELMPELLKLPNRPPIIACSSHAKGSEALLLAGADAECSKLKFQHIGRVIEDALENNHSLME